MTLPLGPIAEKRRAARGKPKLTQLDLPLDLAGALSASIAKYAVEPEQSSAARQVTEMVVVSNDAMRKLTAKTGSDGAKKTTRRRVP